MILKLQLAAAGLFAAQALAARPATEPLFSYSPNLLPLQKNAGSADLFPMGKCNGFKLEEATIDDMQKAMRSGKLTSVQLVTCYLTRTYQTQEYIK